MESPTPEVMCVDDAVGMRLRRIPEGVVVCKCPDGRCVRQEAPNLIPDSEMHHGSAYWTYSGPGEVYAES